MVIGANLSGARLTGADLTEALWPPESDVPEGWQLDTNLGRLKLADHASGTVTPS